jgi:alpha-D-xyloside xylohydrolase
LNGKRLFQQSEISLTPAVVNGENTYHPELYSKLWNSNEGFYGLGQQQGGVWNYRGEAVDLSQDNTKISIPFFFPAMVTAFSGAIAHEAGSTIVFSTPFT